MCRVEVISKRTRRPVLSLTYDDLYAGISMRHTMMHWLLLAEKWKAILLIDHCDAFIRTSTGRPESDGQGRKAVTGKIF